MRDSKRRRPAWSVAVGSACVAGSVLLAGCAAEPPPPVDRHARLLLLAAGEAGQIADAGDRLKRQLNFADQQLSDGHPAEGRQTLAAAAGTLRESKPADLPPRIRIAGWVSISELSRAAKDKAAAAAACDQAVATLRSLDPAADRPQFAVGVADEVRELNGKPAAAKLLSESVGWTKAMPDAQLRRLAVTSVADAIFTCDDYDAGLAAVRTDPDAAWRSDTLAMLAGSATGSEPLKTKGFLDPSEMFSTANAARSSSPPIITSASPGDDQSGRAPTRVRQPFGQSVDYRSVFGSGSR